MLERYARLPIDSPRPIIWVVALLTLVACPLLLEVEFATDVQAFLPQSEEVETYDKITEQFGRDSSVVNLYVTPIDGSNVLTMQNLADLLVLHHQSSQISGVRDVISVSGFFDDALRDVGTSLDELNGEKCLEYDDSNFNDKYDDDEICNYSDWDKVWDSIKPTSLSGNFTMYDLDFVMDVLVHRDMEMNPFVAPGVGEVKSAPIAYSTIIMINLDPDLTTVEKKQAGKEFRILAEQHNTESGSDIHAEAFSVHLLAYDVDQSTQDTNLLMASGMLIVTVVLLWITFRHWSYVVLPLITLIISVIWTFSFGVLMGVTFTAIDVAVVPLVVGLGIDFSVHISRRYQEGINAGNSVEESLLDSQIHTGRALSLAAITTIIAFLSGISGGVGPVRDFSLLCAAGIFSSFVLTVLFYTSLRYVFDSGLESKTPVVQGSEFITNTISRASELVDKQPQAIVSTVAIITLLAMGGASQISTSFTLDDFLSDDLDTMVTGDNIQAEFRGASYSQSQILIEGDIATTTFWEGLTEFEEGKNCPPQPNCGLSDDEYIIKIGIDARIDSIRQTVREAIDSEKYNVMNKNNTTEEWIVTNFFRVTSGEDITINWETELSTVSPTLEVTIFWYDENANYIHDESLVDFTLDPVMGISNGEERVINYHSNVIVEVPSEAKKSRIEFRHLQDNDQFVDSIVYGSSVQDSNEYIYVQSLIHTFNLTDEAKIFSQTTNLDIANLYDYLYQRDLDIVDPFTETTYSEHVKHVLYSCLLYTSPRPRDATLSRMPSSA
mgnify:FL=1